jgi:hypothetical protein
MAEVSIHEIYERQIRWLPIRERLRLLALISEELSREAELPPDRPRRDIMDFHGVGKDSWDGMDAQEYVNRLREGQPTGPDEAR